MLILLLALAGAVTDTAAQSELSGQSGIAYDTLSVTSDMYELPLMPAGAHSYPASYNLPKIHLPQPFEMPLSAGYGMPDFPALSNLPPAPVEFVMRDRDLFLSISRFRSQEGIVIPAAGVNSNRMILSNSGYLPLVLYGDHALGLTGSRQRFPSMGFSNSLSVGYVWQATDGITLYGNLNASDNMYHLNRFKDIGVSGRARVRVTDGIWLNGYGSYSLYNNAGMQPMPPGMYPKNSFGGTIEVKVSDGFGIEGGAFREYDPFSRRWVTQPYIMPVFY